MRLHLIGISFDMSPTSITTTPMPVQGVSSSITPIHGTNSSETPLTIELKNYFGQLLASSRPRKDPRSRKQLTGLGESLTSEEAMKRVQERT